MPRSTIDIKNLIFGNSLGRKHANYFYPGSMLDSLASDVAQLIVGSELEYRSNLRDSFVSTAGSAALDRIANDFGLSRKMDTVARVLDTDRNIIISTSFNENLLDVLLDYNINLNGLQICDFNDTIRFIVQQVGSISSTSKSVYVGAVANASGAGYNVEKGSLNRFVKNYPRLQVTNTAAIRNGQDQEGDASLRVRIFTKIESNQKNISSLNYYLNQSIPDIGKSHITGSNGGSSGIYVYVQPTSGVFYEEKYLSNISNQLNSFAGPGQSIKVNNFIAVPFSFEVTAIVKQNIDASQVQSQIQSMIINYFNGIQGGQSVSLNSIKNLIGGIPGVKLLAKTSGDFKKVTYQVQDGSIYFSYDATLQNEIILQPNQIGTVGNIILNVSNE